MKPEFRARRPSPEPRRPGRRRGKGMRRTRPPGRWATPPARRPGCRTGCREDADALYPEEAETNASVFAAHLAASQAAQEACDQADELVSLARKPITKSAAETRGGQFFRGGISPRGVERHAPPRSLSALPHRRRHRPAGQGRRLLPEGSHHHRRASAGSCPPRRTGPALWN